MKGEKTMGIGTFFAPALRSYYITYFDNFRKAYVNLFSENEIAKLYSKDENTDCNIYSAEYIYNSIMKYHNNIPMETLADTISDCMDNGDFFSLMIARMVASDNLIKNCSLNEDLLSDLNLEDNAGVGELSKIYNLIIESFKNEIFYKKDFERMLEELETYGRISQDELDKCRFLLNNYDEFQKLIDASIELQDKCGDAVDSVCFFNEDGNISGYEINSVHKFWYNGADLINDLDNYYEDRYWKNLNPFTEIEDYPIFFKHKYIPNRQLRTVKQSFEAAENEKNCTPIYSSSIFHSHILDPLILDLDNDGYNVETKENGTNFDLDKNGFAEKINWTIKDGFLCLDLNGNGSIDNGGEVFGDQTM